MGQFLLEAWVLPDKANIPPEEFLHPNTLMRKRASWGTAKNNHMPWVPNISRSGNNTRDYDGYHALFPSLGSLLLKLTLNNELKKDLPLAKVHDPF